MLSVYPYASGSFYTASYATTASYAVSASYISYVVTASNAGIILNPKSGSRGKSVCLLTTEQYSQMIVPPYRLEICPFTS